MNGVLPSELRELAPSDKRLPLQGIMIGDGLVDPVNQRPIKSYKAHAVAYIDAQLSEQGTLRVFSLMIARNSTDRINPIQSNSISNQATTIATRCERALAAGATDQPPNHQVHDCNQLQDFILHVSGTPNRYDIRTFDPPYDKDLESRYMSQLQTLKALNVVPKDAASYDFSFVTCNTTVREALDNDIHRSVKAYVAPLLEHLRVIFYAGQFDMQDGTIGTCIVHSQLIRFDSS